MSRSDIESRSDWLSKASILTDALPFMRRYADSRVVVRSSNWTNAGKNGYKKRIC